MMVIFRILTCLHVQKISFLLERCSPQNQTSRKNEIRILFRSRDIQGRLK